MLTVKLMKGHVTKIVEAIEVNIYPAGKPEPVPTPIGGQPTSLPTNKVREVAGSTPNGGSFAFYISDSDAECQAGVVDLWDCAYIENAHGATTERVHAY